MVMMGSDLRLGTSKNIITIVIIINIIVIHHFILLLLITITIIVIIIIIITIIINIIMYRSSETVRLIDLLDAAKDRMKAALGRILYHFNRHLLADDPLLTTTNVSSLNRGKSFRGQVKLGR